jgi:zinc transport system ATP-binding protein
MQKAVEIKNVSVYYNNVCALSNINLTITKNDFLGVIGPNGSGKSTLLKVIAGIIKPSSGNIFLFGKPINEYFCSTGYVPQHLKFDKNFPINVMEVVLMGRLNRKKRLFFNFNEDDKKITTKILKNLNIYNLKNRQISELSGGQLQKVLIARALAVNPKIILLDEPTASLDAHSKNNIYALLKELNKTITIVLVSHDMGSISSYVKNLACLNKYLYYHGKPELSEKILDKTYGCPVEILAHGKVPHRVLKEHEVNIND